MMELGTTPDKFISKGIWREMASLVKALRICFNLVDIIAQRMDVSEKEVRKILTYRLLKRQESIISLDWDQWANFMNRYLGGSEEDQILRSAITDCIIEPGEMQVVVADQAVLMAYQILIVTYSGTRPVKRQDFSDYLDSNYVFREVTKHWIGLHLCLPPLMISKEFKK
jgi:hypothetical protein